ncbi:neurochondrin-like [Dendronephthya gigantea]|uniref:neurochondrin-like n=1 Tax=Dendronephthya gigantea TaxID=151771 RepID=UPI00106BE69A|nr:neurochondrin-like [Dendronephthya gigantea]
MSNSSQEEKIKTAKEQLKNCLHALQHASTDNEKMAALLLFTHLMKTNQALAVDANELFQAVDVQFLVRLLKSTNVPDGCPEFMYKSLALNILSSFTDYDILSHPLLVANLNIVAEVLAMDRAVHETTQMLDDSIAILLVFSRKAEGCNYLLKSNCIPLICKAIIQNPEVHNLFEISRGILVHLPKCSWQASHPDLLAILTLTSSQFATNQDLVKFSACDKLLALLTSLCEARLDAKNSEIFTSKLTDEIQHGLNDILQSRCIATHKYIAIQITKAMIELLGLEWTVISTNENMVLDMKNTKFLLLILSIIEVELWLILDNGEIDLRSDFIVSCYVILEKTIEFLICDEEHDWSFSNEVIMKIHLLLTETFDRVIHFLTQIASQDEPTQCYKKPIIIATVRVLCVWLSEETNALADKISKVLPILIEWARLGQDNTGEDDIPTKGRMQNEILLHLLPPLCHLSADETFCGILITEGCHVLLADLFQQLWQTQQAENSDHDPSNLITLCNVLLNISVLEVDLIKTNSMFGQTLECIMIAVPKIVNLNCFTLTAHFILLGLILFRHRVMQNNSQLTVIQKNFISNCIKFLKQVHVSVTGEENGQISWHDISELWFLSVQNLVACAKTFEPVKTILLSSGWPEEIELWIKTNKSLKQDNNHIPTDMESTLLPLINLK